MVPAAEDLRIERTRTGSMTIVAPLGELDFTTVGRLRNAIDWALAGRPLILAIDLRGVTFMDAAAVRLLHATQLRCAGQARRMLLVQGRGLVDRLCRICGLADAFELVADLEV